MTISNILIFQGWRLEPSSYTYTIQHQPGTLNVVPDTLTTVSCCSVAFLSNIVDIHKGLCHSGVPQILHFVWSKNLPFSTEDVRKTCASCKVCTQLKPQFYCPPQGTVMKATDIHLMECPSADFKGPLPPTTHSTYTLPVLDKCSYFTFGFPCPNIHTKTVIKCLNKSI